MLIQDPDIQSTIFGAASQAKPFQPVNDMLLTAHAQLTF